MPISLLTILLCWCCWLSIVVSSFLFISPPPSLLPLTARRHVVIWQPTDSRHLFVFFDFWVNSPAAAVAMVAMAVEAAAAEKRHPNLKLTFGWRCRDAAARQAGTSHCWIFRNDHQCEAWVTAYGGIIGIETHCGALILYDTTLAAPPDMSQIFCFFFVWFLGSCIAPLSSMTCIWIVNLDLCMLRI